VTNLVAGLLEVVESYRENDMLLGPHGIRNEISAYITEMLNDGVKEGHEQFESEFDVSRQIHDIIVRTITDPSPLFSGLLIPEYWSNKYYLSFTTENMIKVIQTSQLLPAESR
jgi:hypothetical protein